MDPKLAGSSSLHIFKFKDNVFTKKKYFKQEKRETAHYKIKEFHCPKQSFEFLARSHYKDRCYNLVTGRGTQNWNFTRNQSKLKITGSSLTLAKMLRAEKRKQQAKMQKKKKLSTIIK